MGHDSSGGVDNHLLTQNRKPVRESEQGDHQGPALWMRCSGVTYKELLTGAELTLKQLHHQGHPIMGNSQWKLEYWHTLHSLQEDQQLKGCFSQLSWSKSVSPVLTAYVHLGAGGPMIFGQFQELPGAFESKWVLLLILNTCSRMFCEGLRNGVYSRILVFWQCFALFLHFGREQVNWNATLMLLGLFYLFICFVYF